MTLGNILAMSGNPPDKDDDILHSITPSVTAKIDSSGNPEPAKVGEQDDGEMVANFPKLNEYNQSIEKRKTNNPQGLID
jgi:hypothetical protein